MVGRVISAAFSVLTLAVALLGASGFLPARFMAGEMIAQEAPVEGGGAPAVPRARTPLNHTPTPEPMWPTLSPDDPTALPPRSGEGKRIVYSLGKNRVWLVSADNRVVRTYLVSGTKYGQVRPGTYEVYRRKRTTTSWHGTERMNYMVTFTHGKNAAIGFHDIPVSIETGKPIQKLTQLGQSLSDGCVRQAPHDAKALWDFAPLGTTVVVLP
jgi:lipoprotein-anchoring transpeptidase ErfK/SrfK